MAEVVAPGSQANSKSQSLQNAPHGIKRAADSSLEHEQRLSKRFDLLNLVDDNGTRLYFGVPGSSNASVSRTPANLNATSHSSAAALLNRKRERKSRPPPADDAMPIDETPHRVYIHDLDAELSDIESDEDTPIFLPDIEKHLSKIPRHVLLGPEPKSTEDNQLVLYNVPASLSVPEEHDNVRKAIVEARQRIRAKQGNPVAEFESPVRQTALAPHMLAVDEDAMDID
ncbi:hypothetical protein BKA66DRAFT_406606 [Pyrenochaeta sp. MPI-SDFR-AT-0127]|nr:hypothetical protein BKA66DRAFT_406606 [Pyrenochaeta sp. MPI-SDFR-AT-0127]